MGNGIQLGKELLHGNQGFHPDSQRQEKSYVGKLLRAIISGLLTFPTEVSSEKLEKGGNKNLV